MHLSAALFAVNLDALARDRGPLREQIIRCYVIVSTGLVGLLHHHSRWDVLSQVLLPLASQGLSLGLGVLLKLLLLLLLLLLSVGE